MTEALPYNYINEQISEMVTEKLKLLERVRQIDDMIDNMKKPRPLLVSLLRITWVGDDDDGGEAA